MKRTVKQILSDSVTLLWKDICNARWVIIILITYFAFFGYFSYSTCPMLMLTGFPCPACGLSRAGIWLLQLEFRKAWQMHPFIYGVVVYILLFAWNRYMLQRKSVRWLVYVGIGLVLCMTAFYVYRMFVYFPDTPPMNYYPNNLLRRIGI